MLFRLRVHENDDRVFAYRAPRPDRKYGVNIYRILVGGVLAMVKVDQRRMVAPELEPLWLRGSSQASALVAPAQTFEEFRIAGQAIAANSALSRFLDRQEAKAIGRNRSPQGT